MILLFGCRVLDRSRCKLDKICEVQQFVRIERRKLGSLLQLFNEKQIPRIKYKNGLYMLMHENFDVLKMYFEARTFTDDLMVKAGLTHGLYYTIKNVATI